MFSCLFKRLNRCNIAIIYEYMKCTQCVYTDVLNVHMHRNPPKHWRLSWFRYETFITFLTFRLSTRGERDTIFTMLTVLSEPTARGASRRPRLALPRLASPGSEDQLAPSKFKSQLTAFFKIPKNPCPSLPGIMSFTSPVLFPIRGFYYDICDCHIIAARAWTPALNVCPYPCTVEKF